MPTLDPRIDTYIARAAPFAQPVLAHLRAQIHAACPDVVETIKWSMPSFEHHGLLCNMAAFKAHCALSFWKGKLLFGAAASDAAMGQLGRITAIADLPAPAALRALIARAAALNETGARPARPARAPARPVEVPDDLAAALAAHPAAGATFAAFPPGQRREYVDWITEAKTAPTRARRLAQSIEWLAEGKKRNWKYQNGC